jgi:hypothetical protein
MLSIIKLPIYFSRMKNTLIGPTMAINGITSPNVMDIINAFAVIDTSMGLSAKSDMNTAIGMNVKKLIKRPNNIPGMLNESDC